ncbi:hypothetical protein HDU93_000636 [Gonapodya sp. JEL0774]|nr:hypothetical protein HDU93_000636 [Gonapodya sp. JEL0774]
MGLDGIPANINIQIVNGFAKPSPVDLKAMKFGFNIVTSKHKLFAHDGSPIPRHMYKLQIEYHEYYPVHLSPRELERQWIPKDDLSKPLYRVPYHIVDLENEACTFLRYGDPNFPLRAGECVACGLVACLRLYYKEPEPGESAVWTVQDLQELALRALEKEFGQHVLGRLCEIGMPDWNNPQMLLDIAFFTTTAVEIGSSGHYDYLDKHWRRLKIPSTVTIREDIVRGLIRKLVLVQFTRYLFHHPEAGHEARLRPAYEKRFYEVVSRIIQEQLPKSMTDIEKDQLLNAKYEYLKRLDAYREAKPGPDPTTLCMNPFPFANNKDVLQYYPLSDQIDAHFQHWVRPNELNSDLPPPKKKLIAYTMDQLRNEKSYQGVHSADIGVDEDKLDKDWETEYLPIRTLLLFWWKAADSVNQPRAWDSEETTTFFTGNFFELLCKYTPGKVVTRNQKPPNGIRSDRPDKAVTVDGQTVMEFEAKSPINPDFHLDAMKGACSGTHSARELRRKLGPRQAGGKIQGIILVLARGPIIYCYITLEPMGESNIAVTIPIYKPVTIPISRNATTEEMIEVVGLISSVWNQVDNMCNKLQEVFSISIDFAEEVPLPATPVPNVGVSFEEPVASNLVDAFKSLSMRPPSETRCFKFKEEGTIGREVDENVPSGKEVKVHLVFFSSGTAGEKVTVLDVVSKLMTILVFGACAEALCAVYMVAKDFKDNKELVARLANRCILLVKVIADRMQSE